MPYEEFKTSHNHAHEHPWIIAGGALLACVAGYINVIVLEFFHIPVSHMTGAASRIGPALIEKHTTDLKIIFSIVLSFYLGAVISGIIISGAQLKPGRRYGATLMGEAFLLCIASAFIQKGRLWGIPFVAMACGMQNAMASSFYGLVIRTTHVTGIVTDLGVITGHFLRGQRIHLWKVTLLVSLLGGFIMGGIIGAYLYTLHPHSALWIVAGGCFGMGLSYATFIHLKKQKAHSPA